MTLIKVWLKWLGIGLVINLIVAVAGLLVTPLYWAATWIGSSRPSLAEAPVHAGAYVGLQLLLFAAGIAIFGWLFTSFYPFNGGDGKDDSGPDRAGQKGSELRKA